MTALKYATIFLASSFLMGASSCSITREQIDAIVWASNAEYWQTQTDVCDRIPELRQMGIGRPLESGQTEFISWCNPLITEFLHVKDEDVTAILNGTLPEGK